MFNEIATLKNTRRVLVVIMVLLVFAPFETMKNDFGVAEEKANNLKPFWDTECLVYVRSEIVRRTREVSSDPQEYFRVVGLKHTWLAAVSRYDLTTWRASAEQIRDRQMLGSMATGLNGVTEVARKAYNERYGDQAIFVAGQAYRVENPSFPWQQVPVEWSPNLGAQFLSVLLWIGVLSLFFTFLKFWEEGNTVAFFRRLPIIIPMSFTIGPFAARYAYADKQLIQSDVWLMTTFASALVGMVVPGAGAFFVVKAQAPASGGKATQSSGRSNSGGQKKDSEVTAETATDDGVRLLRKVGITQINVEALPIMFDKKGKLQELSIEYLGAIKFGKFGTLNIFGFGELRPDGQFTNHSVGFSPIRWLPISLMSEQGWNGRRFFGDAGVKWNISGTPGLKSPLGKVFDFVILAYTRKYAGAAPQSQIILAWDTKDWRIWKDILSLSSEGFYRIRPGGINYGQPQILVQFGRCKWIKGLVQFDTAGHQVGVSAGAKFFFALR